MSTHISNRFNNRADNYSRYRPRYPGTIVDYLQQEYHIHPDALVADIGAGTGHSSRLFLEKGYMVIGVEPNAQMALKSTEMLAHFDGYTIVPGSAEQTQLPSQSVNVVIAGQAFHWFNREAVKKEMKRILQPGGLVILFWNERSGESAFEKAYEKLISEHAVNYTPIKHRDINLENIQAFFNPNPCASKKFLHYQDLGFEALLGLVLSSSTIPLPGEGGYESMEQNLRQLYEQFVEDGQVRITYTTNVYISTVA